MITQEKRMEIFELYDLLKSVPQTAQLAGVDKRTVIRALQARAAGTNLEQTNERDRVTDPYIDKIAEWVDKSNAKIRADVVHEQLCDMGYTGSQRTTRRIVAKLKKSWRREHHRSYKPWITEPGLWLQYDFGDGPIIDGAKTVLFCAWLAWSRYRVIIPLVDKTLPSVIAALDASFREIGGCPTYVLTDNEKTVTSHHIAGVAVRNRAMVSASSYYGITIATCVPYDPESKGGSESTVKIAKADLVPKDTNLLEDYQSFAELEQACRSTMDKFNSRIHSITRARPCDMLKTEVQHLHSVAHEPYTVAFGESRRVSWSNTITFRNARYSVPYNCGVDRVWVRVNLDEVIIVAADLAQGNVTELARHPLLGPGKTSLDDAHYKGHTTSPTDRVPKAKNPNEAAFLSIGHGAHRWLIEASAVGSRHIEKKMAEAVCLTQTNDVGQVDQALGIAALAGRFAFGDLVSILEHTAEQISSPETKATLQPGTSSWEGFGQ